MHFSSCFLSDVAPVLNNSAKAAVAMMCISVVLVFLLCFGFSWRRRDGESESAMQQRQRQMFDIIAVEEIKETLFVSHITEEEELSLYKNMPASIYREALQRREKREVFFFSTKIHIFT